MRCAIFKIKSKRGNPCLSIMQIFSILFIFLLSTSVSVSGADASYPKKISGSKYSPNTFSFLIASGNPHLIQQRSPRSPVSIQDLNKRYEEGMDEEIRECLSPPVSIEALNKRYEEALKADLRENLYCAVATNNADDTVYNLEMLYKYHPGENHIDFIYQDNEKVKFGLIHLAAAYGFRDVLKILCDNGASLELKDFKEKTALVMAVKEKQNECIKELVSHGAQVKYPVGDEYPTLIHYAAKENKVDILEEIRNAGHSFIDDIGGSWYTVWTPLELALNSESYDSAEFLIKANSPFRKHKIELIQERAHKKGLLELAQFIEEKFYK